MGKSAIPKTHLDKVKTKRAVREAMGEVRHASRPRTRSLKEGLSWLVALAAGGTVAWRSFQAARQAEDFKDFDPTANLPALSPADRQAQGLPTTARGKEQRSDKSEPGVGAKAKSAAKPGEATTSADQPKVKGGALGLGKELMTRFNTDECSTRAQALSFIGILSLVPLLLCALAAMSFLIHDPQQAANYVKSMIQNMLPGKEAGKAAEDFIQQTNIAESARALMQGKWWGIVIGIGSLLWAALSLVVSATTPMNAAWDVKETRSFINLRLVCLGVLFGAGLMFILSLLPSSGPTFLRNLHIPWLGLPQQTPFWVDALFELLAWAIDICMFVLLYKFLPNTKVSWKAALFGGAVTGFLWELFKKGFALYLAHFGNFNKAYGALGGVFLLVTWIYYSCIVLLAGAILCKMYHEHKEEGGVAKRDAEPKPA